ncbi:MAG: polyphosphate polymerase domain-containing protein [Eubacteriales bacterium]
MGKGSTFQRFEYKYRMTQEQYGKLCDVMKETMVLDEFGRNTINNIYFDTPDFLLIRRSLEKPVYKEKLRVRWYGCREEKTPIYIELKKKYKGVVYKRRIKRNWKETKGYFREHQALPHEDQGQITKELDYFMEFYHNLRPALFLGYEREAYYGAEDPDFRMTFDFNIRCNDGDIYHQKDNNGIRVIGKEEVLLEVKTGQGLPHWLLDFFAVEEVYRNSFSKYGTAYNNILLPKILSKEVAV